MKEHLKRLFTPAYHKERLKRLFTLAHHKDRPRRLLTPAYYTENRLLMGGALIFCSAVVVQLLQVSPLSKALWVALWAAAVALPPLVAAMRTYATHERVKICHETTYVLCLEITGGMATLVCATAVFSHFLEWAGVAFFLLSLIAFKCTERDENYHIKLNAPNPDDQASSLYY